MPAFLPNPNEYTRPTKATAADYAPASYLIDEVWPEQCEPHIICGPSGVGKTTMLFQLLKQWRAGGPWLDYACHPKPFCYVALDRPKSTTISTLRRCGIDPASFPMLGKEIDLPKERDLRDGRLDQLINDCLIEYPGSKLVIIDGFGFLTPHGRTNDYLIVGEFLQRTCRISEREGITVVGLMHTPKMRQGSEVKDPRQKILGSVAGGGVAGTLMILESLSKTEGAGARQVELLLYPRNGRRRREVFNEDENGLLVLDETAAADSALVISERIKTDFAPGDGIPLSAFEAYGKQLGMTKKWLKGELKRLVEAKVLVQTGKKTWQKPFGFTADQEAEQLASQLVAEPAELAAALPEEPSQLGVAKGEALAGS